LHVLSDNLASYPLGLLGPTPSVATLAAASFQLVSDAFSVSLQLALPLAAALGLAEFGLSLVARVAGVPWVPVAFAPARGLLAIAVLFLVSRALLGSLPELFRHMLGAATQLLGRA
jgi:type III secretory pathway component EscT